MVPRKIKRKSIIPILIPKEKIVDSKGIKVFFFQKRRRKIHPGRKKSIPIVRKKSEVSVNDIVILFWRLSLPMCLYMYGQYCSNDNVFLCIDVPEFLYLGVFLYW